MSTRENLRLIARAPLNLAVECKFVSIFLSINLNICFEFRHLFWVYIETVL